MHEKNHTLVSEIILLGFHNLHNLKIPLFSLFLLIYIMTVWENVLIIVLVSSSQNLQSPMYFLLRQLALSDLLGSTIIVPTLLQTVFDKTKVSLVGCISQISFFCATEAFECLFLAVMSYDRYVAICSPLRYTSLMNQQVCQKLIFASWTLSFGIEMIVVNLIGVLKFCDQNTINHFFCDLFPLLELSCSDTSFFQIEVIVQSIPFVFCPLILIIVSYMCIARAILKIASNTGRQKAFSTCSSHLTVVSIYYGTLIAIYLTPSRKQLQTISKVLSLLYTVVIPLINPVIYSLRSTNIKEALRKSIDL